MFRREQHIDQRHLRVRPGLEISPYKGISAVGQSQEQDRIKGKDGSELVCQTERGACLVTFELVEVLWAERLTILPVHPGRDVLECEPQEQTGLL